MGLISEIIFCLLTLLSLGLFVQKILRIRRSILLGKTADLNDHPGQRWRNVILLALGQKKMFQKPIVAILHLFIYIGFVIINIELLEIIIDGLLGTHRIFGDYLSQQGFSYLYDFIINTFEILALLVIIACIAFLTRRNILKLKRFMSKDLEGWPSSDANYILIIEIILMCLFLLMNAADPAVNFIVSNPLGLWLKQNFNESQLMLIATTAWWLHIIGIYAFMNYLPYSKHLHIILAFPNAYYAPLIPKGVMHNMPAIQNEVLYAMQPELAPTNAAAPESFGAKEATELSWKNLMDAYSCSECGRCTEACPANITGKVLSPRKIMMATRDRIETISKNIALNKVFVPDGKTLLHDYISVAELRACTTCNACVQECPISISPLDIIIELRRSLVMEQSNAPQEWNSMFSNIENNFAPWKLSPDDRDAWTKA
jgi:heterodisulfide reductase subunit C/nitrate reductase gamma subunit